MLLEKVTSRLEHLIANMDIWLTLETARVFLSCCLALAMWLLLMSFWSEPKVWVDADTGCQYIVTESGALTPRIAVNGGRFGCGESLPR